LKDQLLVSRLGELGHVIAGAAEFVVRLAAAV
jgi:hypothetical protein